MKPTKPAPSKPHENGKSIAECECKSCGEYRKQFAGKYPKLYEMDKESATGNRGLADCVGKSGRTTPAASPAVNVGKQKASQQPRLKSAPPEMEFGRRLKVATDAMSKGEPYNLDNAKADDIRNQPPIASANAPLTPFEEWLADRKKLLDESYKECFEKKIDTLFRQGQISAFEAIERKHRELCPNKPMCIHTNCREEATKNFCANHFGQTEAEIREDEKRNWADEGEKYIRSNVVPDKIRKAITEMLRTVPPNIMHLCAKDAYWKNIDEQDEIEAKAKSEGRKEMLEEYLTVDELRTLAGWWSGSPKLCKGEWKEDPIWNKLHKLADEQERLSEQKKKEGKA
jgi:hypothetical protein